jgi:hypothetical protein
VKSLSCKCRTLITSERFLFLAVNRHKHEFIRSTTSRKWNRIYQEAQHEALDSFLGSQGFDAEDLALALLKTGLAYRGQRYFDATSRCKMAAKLSTGPQRRDMIY